MLMAGMAKRWWLALLTVTLLGGCAADPAAQFDRLPVATPRQPSLQDQVAAVRIGQFLDAADRDEAELALLRTQLTIGIKHAQLQYLLVCRQEIAFDALGDEAQTLGGRALLLAAQAAG